jgi:hypothetical protein
MLVVGVRVGPAQAADIEGSQTGQVVQASSQGGDASEPRPPLFTLSEVSYIFQKFAVAESPAQLMDQLQLIRATSTGAVPR